MKRVLVVEDDKFLVNAYRVKLSKAGYDVKVATDGEEVMKLLQTFVPDMIILDLVIPKKDGFSVLQDLKSTNSLKDIPIIVASNLGQKEDIERATKLGANDYIVKTDLSLKMLLEKIKNIVGE